MAARPGNDCIGTAVVAATLNGGSARRRLGGCWWLFLHQLFIHEQRVADVGMERIRGNSNRIAWLDLDQSSDNNDDVPLWGWWA